MGHRSSPTQPSGLFPGRHASVYTWWGGAPGGEINRQKSGTSGYSTAGSRSLGNPIIGGRRHVSASTSATSFRPHIRKPPADISNDWDSYSWDRASRKRCATLWTFCLRLARAWSLAPWLYHDKPPFHPNYNPKQHSAVALLDASLAESSWLSYKHSLPIVYAHVATHFCNVQFVISSHNC